MHDKGILKIPPFRASTRRAFRKEGSTTRAGFFISSMANKRITEIFMELENLNRWRESILRKDDFSFEKKKEWLERVVRQRESLEKELDALRNQESILHKIGEKNPIIKGAVDWWSGKPTQRAPIINLQVNQIPQTEKPIEKTTRKKSEPKDYRPKNQRIKDGVNKLLQDMKIDRPETTLEDAKRLYARQTDDTYENVNRLYHYTPKKK